MHTIAQTDAFVRASNAVGMGDEEVDRLVTFLAENPTAGEEMPGTGGCRKLRWAKAGKGKRGGHRVITFFSGERMPVFLLTVFSKGERTNLSKSEQNALKVTTKEIVRVYQGQSPNR